MLQLWAGNNVADGEIRAVRLRRTTGYNSVQRGTTDIRESKRTRDLFEETHEEESGWEQTVSGGTCPRMGDEILARRSLDSEEGGTRRSRRMELRLKDSVRSMEKSEINCRRG